MFTWASLGLKNYQAVKTSSVPFPCKCCIYAYIYESLSVLSLFHLHNPFAFVHWIWGLVLAMFMLCCCTRGKPVNATGLRGGAVYLHGCICHIVFFFLQKKICFDFRPNHSQYSTYLMVPSVGGVLQFPKTSLWSTPVLRTRTMQHRCILKRVFFSSFVETFMFGCFKSRLANPIQPL